MLNDLSEYVNGIIRNSLILHAINHIYLLAELSV